MSNGTLKISPQASNRVEQLQVPMSEIEADASATTTEQNRIQLTVRSRLKVLRVAPPVDDGFRPFRVF